MFEAAAAHLLLIAIVLASIVLMLVRPRGIAEAWWISAGAALLILLRLVPLRLAGSAIAEGTDVYLFLAGMMLLSEIARLYGVFDWLAQVAADHARGSAVRLFTLIYAVGTLVTIFLSNDATAVVLTPAVLASVRRSKAEPLPYLFACAFIANAASFMLPISNPANLVVFRTQMPPLGRWLVAFGFPAVVSIIVTYAVLRWCFRRELRNGIAQSEGRTRLTGNGRLVLAGIVFVIVVLLVSSSLGWDLGLPTCLAALVIATIAAIRARTNPTVVLREISWSVIPLVAGLFVMVGAMDSVGAMRVSVDVLHWAESLPAAAGAYAAAFAVGIGNNLVNNLPLGLIAGSTLKITHSHGLIANAVLIGVDLGPNLSVTGSLATILWLIAMRREGIHVGFGTFLKVGLLAMPVALALATGAAILVAKG
jgi:arsenical pump membrane protein